MNADDTQKKLIFLNRLLEKNPELQKQFTEFMNDEPSDEFSSFEAEKYIEDVAAEFTRELETLDFSDPDWEMYTPRHSGYIPDYEAMEHLAEEMIAEKFELFNRHILGLFSDAKADLALLSLAAIYDACMKADIPDDNDTIYEHTEYLLEVLQELQSGAAKEAERIVLPARQVRCFFQGLFEHFQSNYSDNDDYLRFFEPLMLSLIGDKETAEYVERIITDRNIPREFIPQTATELYRVTGNTVKWIEQAEQLYDKDVTVARNLLAYYADNEYDEFIRISKNVWAAALFQRDLAEFIFRHIGYEKHPGFYKDVLLWITSTYKRLSDYGLLREILQPDEKNSFLRQYKNDHLFYTGILEKEGRYADILHFIRQHSDSWNFNYMINMILEPYPEESFGLLKQKILNTIENERGRNVYRRIVEWLRIAQQIEGKKAEANELAFRLYDWQPRLPALRDELKQAGFMA